MLFLFTFYSSQFLQKYVHCFNIDNKFLEQHIRMISKGSCDPEDWSNGC